MENLNRTIAEQQVRDWTLLLRKYKAGLTRTQSRIVAAENWWKLRNDTQEDLESEVQKRGFRPKSGWLHNVVTSKHADAMESFPEPVILPREAGDRQEATTLQQVLPVILKQNGFYRVYDRASWQKCKTGTAVYKVTWDAGKEGGLGDISVTRANLLNLFWEPGVEDIQQSPYFFHTELTNREEVEGAYPEVKGRLKGDAFTATKFLYDDTVDTTDKVTVIDVYYHRYVNGKRTLQYCKFCCGLVLYATENDTQRPTEQREQVDPTTGQTVTQEVETGESIAERGLYEHGKYPYVFDALYPIEGSPCGYGYIDLCASDQTQIDELKRSMMINCKAGAAPRYFVRSDGGLNEDEFTNVENALVHTSGNLSEDSVRLIDYRALDGNYIELLNQTVQEMRETSGNTETATGSTSAGVTAASAIAALQEASGKGSRDASKSSWDAYTEIITMCIELMRQFYTAPRTFRITGQQGQEEFVTYQNSGLQPQSMGNIGGVDMGYRVPAFDIDVKCQKANSYTTLAQNEMALQFFNLGFFDPARAEQVTMCMEMMEFSGKDELMQKVQKNGTLYDQMQTAIQYAASLAEQYGDTRALQQLQSIAQTVGMQAQPTQLQPEENVQAAAGGAGEQEEHALVTKAREQSRQSAEVT